MVRRTAGAQPVDRLRVDDFGWLLKGVGLRRFLDESFERAPLHLGGRPKGHYDRLLKPGALDALMAQSRDFLASHLELHPTPTARPDGVILPPGSPQMLRAALAQGSTLVLRHAEACWLPMQRLARAIADRLTAPCDVTLFLTPPGHRGFPLHFDVYDSFILQIDGAKEWRIHAPDIVLPYGRQWTALEGPGVHGAARNPLQIVRLEAGDLLYLPRGFPHEAHATTGAARATRRPGAQEAARPSLHLTFAFRPYLWRDLLVDLIDEAAEDDQALRHAFPLSAHAVAVGGRVAAPPPRVAALIKALGGQTGKNAGPDQAQMDQAWTRGRESLIEALDPMPDALPGPMPKPVTRTTDRVTRAPGVLASLRRRGDSLILTFPGDTLRAPLATEPALRFIAGATAAFRVGDLPGRLSPRSKVMLVRTLVERGMLRRVQ
jgi:hypothetical protein